MKKTYSEKLKDPRWQKMRLAIMQRDGFACRDCGDGSEELHVHHCHCMKGESWDTPAELILTLCKTCHENRGAVESGIRESLGRYFAAAHVDYLDGVADQIGATMAEPGFDEYPEITISSGSLREYQSDLSWFYDLRQATGGDVIYNAILAIRKGRNGKVETA